MRFAAVCALYLIFVPAHARLVDQDPSLDGTVCPEASFAQIAPENLVDRYLALQSIEVFRESCSNRVDYLWYRGVLLLSLGRGRDAAEVLERAVLLQPDFPGIQLDFAQALAASGDRLSAGSLIERLLLRQDIHSGFRQILEREKEALRRTRTPLTLKASSQLGYETNLNSAPNSRFFTLTSGGGPVVLELDESGRKRSGVAWLNAMGLQSNGMLGNPSEGSFASLDVRSRTSAGGTDYLQLGALAVFQRRIDLLRHSFIVDFRPSFNRIQFGGQTIFGGLGFQTGLEAASWLGCPIRFGPDFERREFPQATTNNGHFYAVFGALRCSTSLVDYALQLRVGLDDAEHLRRPGGDQRRQELTFIGSRIIWGGIKADFIGSVARANDSVPYSALLSQGAVRRLNRILVRLEVGGPIGGTLGWYGSLERGRQGSNLELFQTAYNAVFFGLKAGF